jgi:hypothetical protein
VDFHPAQKQFSRGKLSISNAQRSGVKQNERSASKPRYLYNPLSLNQWAALVRPAWIPGSNLNPAAIQQKRKRASNLSMTLSCRHVGERGGISDLHSAGTGNHVEARR